MENAFFSKEAVNKGRQTEFDWAKAFTIIVMVTVHVYEELSTADLNIVPTGPFRNILEFLAGPLGAPVFMFSMGVGIMYSRNATPGKMGLRGLKLLRNGYLLSFFKGTLFIIIGTALGLKTPMSIADSLFLVSILQFAGMTFFAIALMKKLEFPLPAMLAASIVLSFAGTALNTYDMQGWKQYVLGLLFITNRVTTFPLFLWLFYPVFGMCFACYLQRARDKRRLYIYCFITGGIGLILTCIVYTLCGIDLKTMYMLKDRVFYSQTPLHLLFTSFVILMGMSIYYLLSEVITLRPVVKAVSYLGNNLDIIYIVQWLLIAYTEVAMLAMNTEKVPVVWILPVAVLILLLSVGITRIYLKSKGKIC